MQPSFDATDPRAVRSRAAILAAAARLTDRPPVTFTVSALIADAAVSRSTFYAHFRDVDDVCFALLDERMDEFSEDDVQARLRGDDPEQVTATGHARVIEHLATHREFFAALLVAPERAKVRDRFQQRIAELLSRSMQVIEHHPDEPELSLWATYTASGFTAVATEWLAGRVDLDEAALARTVTAMSPEWLRR